MSGGGGEVRGGEVVMRIIRYLGQARQVIQVSEGGEEGDSWC